MSTKVITPRTAESLVPIAVARAHCKFTTTAQDALLAIWRDAAFSYAEHYTSRSLGAQVRELALDEFPCGPIRLVDGPATSITSVRYIDGDGVEQTIDPGAYTLDDYSDPQWLVPAYGTSWPTALAVVNAVKVRYGAGAPIFPPAAYQAILLLIGHAEANREAVSAGTFAEVPFGVKALLDTLTDYSGA